MIFSSFRSCRFFLFLALVLISAGFYGCSDDDQDDNTVSLTILQTSDVHNHASGYGPFTDYTPTDTSDSDSVLGGYARLASKINEIRGARNNNNTLLFDSGDFFMGTVYDMTATDPVALEYFKTMKYDAIALGNHEFDWGPEGLAALLSAGISNGFNIPVMASNMDASADTGLTALVGANAIRSKLIIETYNGLKVGVLGLAGENAIEDMPAAAPVTFINPPDDYPAIQAMVNDLRNNDKVDLVVVLSHGGIESDGNGDDAGLAENVTGIDIIASGHYHTATEQVVEIGETSKTLIFSPGAYGQYLSRLDVTLDKTTRKLLSYEFALIPIDDTIVGDSTVQAVVENANGQIDAALVQLVPEGIGSVVSSTTFDLKEAEFVETSLGDLSADAVRFAANQLAGLVGDPLYDIGVVPSGVIRDGLSVGKTGAITFSDAFNVLPLGISPEDPTVPGYPMMSIYVNGAEIRNACEISATICRSLGSDYYLNFSGIRYRYNPAGTPGLTVYEVSLTTPDDFGTVGAGTPVDITNIADTTNLYHVVVDYYTLMMMNYATGMGLTIIPKDADGTPIPAEDLLDYRIDADSVTADVQELKAWMSLMSYFQYYIGPNYSGQIPATLYGEGGTALGRAEALSNP